MSDGDRSEEVDQSQTAVLGMENLYVGLKQGCFSVLEGDSNAYDNKGLAT